jgi:hypothetical protein
MGRISLRTAIPDFAANAVLINQFPILINVADQICFDRASAVGHTIQGENTVERWSTLASETKFRWRIERGAPTIAPGGTRDSVLREKPL